MTTSGSGEEPGAGTAGRAGTRTTPGPAAGAGRLASLRLAVRLARRETVRRPWRTVLVASLVALPVAAMAVSAVFIRTDHQTAAERWQATFGAADLHAVVGAGDDPPDEVGGRRLDDILPAGSRAVSYRSEDARFLRTESGRQIVAEVTDLPMTDRLAASIFQVTSGRAAQRPGEVFLTRDVARRLEVGVGDVLRLDHPDTSLRVVGVGEGRAWWGSRLAVFAPGTRFPWREAGAGRSVRQLLVDLPDDTTDEQFATLSRDLGGVSFAPGVAPPGTPGGTVDDGDGAREARAVAWSWVIGAVVLTVVGIVIAAAFAAGARRQLATLGQLAANGATPGDLRRVLFLQGTWTGVVGAVLGLGLAAAVLALLGPHADRIWGRDVVAYTMRAADLVPIVVLGVVAATLAALVPASTAARTPVLAALAGRRPLAPVPRWLTGAGVAVAAAGLSLLGLATFGVRADNAGRGMAEAGGAGGGTVWTLMAILGGVAVLLGTCAVAPRYVSLLEPLAARLRGPSRLAARSLARQRTRTGAVVSAVCATGALAVAASALALGANANDAESRARQQPWVRSDEVQLQMSSDASTSVETEVEDPSDQRYGPAEVPDAAVAMFRDALPGATVHRVSLAGPQVADEAVYWGVREFQPDVGASGPVGVAGGEQPFEMSSSGYAAVTIADGATLDLYDAPQSARLALAEDGVVVFGRGVSGRALLVLAAFRETTSDGTGGKTSRDLAAPVPVRVVADDGLALGSVPPILVTEQRARTLGLEPRPGLVALRAPGPLTGSQRMAVADAVVEYEALALDTQAPGGGRRWIVATYAYDPAPLDARLVDGLLAGAALLLSLFVVATSLALAAAETRDERDVLAVVGAPPVAMRRASGHKALILTLLGAVLAVPAGFLPVAVFTAADGGRPLVFPWRVVVVLVVAVPLVAAAVTTLSSRVALRLRPVRVSTMAFE